MAYAMVRTVSPKASETPRNPIPTVGKAAESTALPHPPRTNQKVPRNSAPVRCARDMEHSFLQDERWYRSRQLSHCAKLRGSARGRERHGCLADRRPLDAAVLHEGPCIVRHIESPAKYR